MIDYSEYWTITLEDDDEMAAIKNALQTLTDVEKIIWFNYVELGSYAKAAKAFKVSPPTMKSYIEQIRKKILHKC